MYAEEMREDWNIARVDNSGVVYGFVKGSYKRLDTQAVISASLDFDRLKDIQYYITWISTHHNETDKLTRPELLAELEEKCGVTAEILDPNFVPFDEYKKRYTQLRSVRGDVWLDVGSGAKSGSVVKQLTAAKRNLYPQEWLPDVSETTGGGDGEDRSQPTAKRKKKKSKF